MRSRILLAIATLLAVMTAPVVNAWPASAHVASKTHRLRKHVRRVAAARRATTTRAGVLRAGKVSTARVSTARRRLRGRHIFASPWTEPTYADSTVGDNVEGEDMAVRKAAVDALGPYNGSVVVTDPASGRILSIVNQKLALKGAFQPCSTVKIMVSLASLQEGIVEPATPLRLTRRFSMDMTRALATSNNTYFAHLGEQLGFERVQKYGKLYGLGEKAGLDIQGEEPGFLTDVLPQSGVGMMTSFGDGIRLTPLELTGIVSTVANGGTLYYLQYPKSVEEVQKFVPRIKRTLDIASLTREIRPGMMGAVEYGTARRANFDPNAPIYGKTGTCTDTAQPGVHLGWFASFNDAVKNRVAVVVLLTGGRGISGPIASGVAGSVYHNLAAARYFDGAAAPANSTAATSPAATQPVANGLLFFQSPFLQ